MEIEIIKNDITTLDADAIVNAANSALAGGGGVDGAIHKAAGPQLDEECEKMIKQIGSCPAGNAVITEAGNLKAKYVIHAVGPIWRGGKNSEEILLASVYKRCLEIAERKGLVVIAFPNISTGVYGFPKKRAAKIVNETVKEMQPHLKKIKKIIFACFDEENFNLYNNYF